MIIIKSTHVGTLYMVEEPISLSFLIKQTVETFLVKIRIINVYKESPLPSEIKVIYILRPKPQT